ncbi:SKI family transcriptional corepressor 2 [Tupaia chinensis]|uniref:SKI family transcriptional corepressor 2 n=1 Tax=Tupaia chinensis TaxID=246437 RepID=L9L3K8_TUPCH|nr:SKI family transcriptional corepressor 2 [Tupaia chinensis]
MASSPLPGPNDILLASPSSAFQPDALSQPRPGHANLKPNQVGQVILYGIPIVSLVIDGQERLCLAQISNTLLKNFSYNEIHNRRVALGITCVQCTPVQLEILRRAGAMPISSRRCGMITKREAERLCKSFLGENRPPKLPDNFAFDVSHECAWGCRGSFIPARYNSSRAKCIKCSYCNMYFSPNKFIFHSHRTPDAKYTQPDAANFNSWRRHLKLTDKSPQDELVFAWEDVKAICSYPSEDSSEDEDDEEEEQEVDVEGHKPPEGEEEEEEGRDPDEEEEEDEETRVLLGDHQHPSLEEQPSYKDNQKTKENNQVIVSTKDDNNFSDKNKDHSFFITDSDASGGDFWRERSGRLETSRRNEESDDGGAEIHNQKTEYLEQG